MEEIIMPKKKLVYGVLTDDDTDTKESILEMTIYFIFSNMSLIIGALLISLSIGIYLNGNIRLSVLVWICILISCIVLLWRDAENQSIQYQKMRDCLAKFDRCIINVDDPEWVAIVGMDNGKSLPWPTVPKCNGRSFKVELVEDD